jgi:glutamine amidotransferase
MSKTATIIDYDLGNLYGLHRALRYIGADVLMTDDPKVVERAEYLILPGVGAFGEGMANLKRKMLVGPIRSSVTAGKPLLGICLGMQLFGTISEEIGIHEGFDLIKGRVVRMTESKDSYSYYKIPHIGWNEIESTGTPWNGTIMDGISNGDFMYFIHSYIFIPEDPRKVLGVTSYGNNSFCSVIRSGNLYGCQFHPEKSGECGLMVLRNFLGIR